MKVLAQLINHLQHQEELRGDKSVVDNSTVNATAK